MGLELAEQLGWDVPEVIVYPTGGGTGVVGIWKAFSELEALGLIGPRRPRMVCVQASGCAPIVRAFREGLEHAPAWKDAETIASGLRVPAAVADYLILKVVRESGGTALEVSDSEILEAMFEIGRDEGIFAAPEGAATWAGLKHLMREGKVHPDERVVLLNTGTGIKYPELINSDFKVLDRPP
jgi:threonine synthase